MTEGNKPKEERSMTTEEIVLKEVRKNIAEMSNDDQIAIAVRAATLRNIVNADQWAPMAFALVGAELAASP